MLYTKNDVLEPVVTSSKYKLPEISTLPEAYILLISKLPDADICDDPEISPRELKSPLTTVILPSDMFYVYV